MSEIRLENVGKSYGGVAALSDVSLVIGDGSFTTIFGPPGAGKSVLLRLLLGLEQVDTGRIWIDGREVTGEAPDARNLAIVFQNLALFPHLTARENITFPLVRRAYAASEIDIRLDALSAVLSISHVLHKKPAALSGGERQRVTIARALIRDAAAWMMDEPIAALDARLRDTTRVELKRLQANHGRTFLYVTHDCDEAMSVADQMVILDGGKVAQVDTPDKIYCAPANLAVARIVGSPRINLLTGPVGKGGLLTPFGILPLYAATPLQTLTAAIRPEALKLAAAEAAPIQGTVADVERLGGFAIMSVEAGGIRLRAVVDGTTRALAGDRVGFRVDPGGLHLFDDTTGSRLIFGGAA